ncbi:hypothetical protein [Streptomyces sp. NPDC002537]
MTENMTLIVTPTPPDPAATSTASLRFDFRLRNRPVTEITLALPIGSKETDLLPDTNKAKLVEAVAGSDERFTPPATKDNAPKTERIWNADPPIITGTSLTYTFKPLKGHKTDNFTVILSDVTINSTPGTAKPAITIREDTTSTDLPAEVKKSNDTFDVGNFWVTGDSTTVTVGTPVNLTWTANNATSFSLALGDGKGALTLPGSQRAYPDPQTPDAPPFTIDSNRTLKLTAYGPAPGHTLKEAPPLNVNVYLGDGEYTDLTVTGELKYPEKEIETRDYFLNKNLEITTPSDGYLTIDMKVYTRLFGCFPATPNPKAPPLRATLEITPPNVNSMTYTMTAADDTAPLTLFTPAKTKVKITPPLTTETLALKQYFTSLIRASLTWSKAPLQLEFPNASTYIYPRSETLPIMRINTPPGSATKTIKVTTEEVRGKVTAHRKDDLTMTGSIASYTPFGDEDPGTTQNVTIPAAYYDLTLNTGSSLSVVAWLESSSMLHLRPEGTTTGFPSQFTVAGESKNIELCLAAGDPPPTQLKANRTEIRVTDPNNLAKGDEKDLAPHVDMDNWEFHDLSWHNYRLDYPLTPGFLFVKLERRDSLTHWAAKNYGFIRQVRAVASIPSQSSLQFKAYYFSAKIGSAAPVQYVLDEVFDFKDIGEQIIIPLTGPPLENEWSTPINEDASRPKHDEYAKPQRIKTYPKVTCSPIKEEWSEDKILRSGLEYTKFPAISGGVIATGSLRIHDDRVELSGVDIGWKDGKEVTVEGITLSKDGVKLPK